MSEIDSIRKMGAGITAAIAAEDWSKVLRRAERIKGILLEATIRDNPVAIREAVKALQEGEKRLELAVATPPRLDGQAVMWQLRSDVGTAALAARIRPIDPRPSNAADSIDVAGMLLKTLQASNGAMTNSELAVRTGKDPAVIARGLASLERSKSIRFWRTGGKRFNLASSASGDRRDSALNSEMFRLGRRDGDLGAAKKSQVTNEKPRSFKEPVSLDNNRPSKMRAHLLSA